ncbi:MAG: hypothetical protein ACRDNT_24620 [Streptosporangiaceae bacterium]
MAGDGILVQASGYQDTPSPTVLGLWDLHTGTVRVLGRMANGDHGLIAATTLPGGQAGLVATFPASCGMMPGFRCIRITGAATLWADAIPGREEILAGGPANAYLVNTVTLAERAVYFLPGDHRSLDISLDVNHSAVVLGYGR